MPDTLKIERFRRALQESEFDAVVAVSPENTWYLSEAVIDTQRTLLERLAVVVWAKGAEPIYIVCTNEETQARKDSWIQEIRGYVEYQESPMAFAAQALTEVGAASGRVGIEKHYLNAHYYEEFAGLLPNARLVEAGRFLDRVRALKTPLEILRLEEAALATDRAIRKGFTAARPGMSEKEIGVLLTSELILGGAEMQGFQVLSAGERTLSTHERASDYLLKSGDLMRTDFGGVFPGGYYSDIARTVCVGKASQRQRDTYQAVWEEHERLISMARPGVTPREMFLTHRDRWEARGWAMKRPHIGHGVGIGLHEFPLLMPSEEEPFQPGLCLYIEPTCIVPSVEKYHVEDLVLVTEGEPKVLSRSADWSTLLETGD